jgi:hypothetical protein
MEALARAARRRKPHSFEPAAVSFLVCSFVAEIGFQRQVLGRRYRVTQGSSRLPGWGQRSGLKARKDSKAVGHEATGGFAFVPPNRATALVGVELAQRWALLQPDHGKLSRDGKR